MLANRDSLICWKSSGIWPAVCRCGEVFFCSSQVPKKKAWFLMIGPPPAKEYTGFTLSNFVRASDAPVISFSVLF